MICFVDKQHFHNDFPATCDTVTRQTDRLKSLVAALIIEPMGQRAICIMVKGGGKVRRERGEGEEGYERK